MVAVIAKNPITVEMEHIRTHNDGKLVIKDVWHQQDWVFPRSNTQKNTQKTQRNRVPALLDESSLVFSRGYSRPCSTRHISRCWEIRVPKSPHFGSKTCWPVDILPLTFWFMFQTYLDIRDVTGLVSIYHEFDHPCVFE